MPHPSRPALSVLAAAATAVVGIGFTGAGGAYGDAFRSHDSFTTVHLAAFDPNINDYSKDDPGDSSTSSEQSTSESQTETDTKNKDSESDSSNSDSTPPDSTESTESTPKHLSRPLPRPYSNSFRYSPPADNPSGTSDHGRSKGTGTADPQDDRGPADGPGGDDQGGE